LLNKSKKDMEAPIVQLGSPNYAKVGAKMTNLEGKEVDMPNAIGKGPDYRYFRATKIIPMLKELFDKPPWGEEEEV